MNAFEWKTAYSVGSETIDGQHRNLINLMNAYYTCHLNGRLDQARGNLGQLLAATVKHFREEEEMMEKAGFPELESHRKVHQELLRSVEGLVKEYLRSQSQETAGKLANFLRIWLTRHILGSDKKYGPYLRRPSPSSAQPA
jgi:hemerythrin-like metal-binding protein